MGTHHAVDVHKLYQTLGVDLNVFSSALKLNTQYMHCIWYDLKLDYKIIENHYVSRIIEMYRILKETGSIYLQMDTRINHWLRYIMDNVFGYDNYVVPV